ncbi:MAG TPA: hypothetical protein VK907_02625 [Phnomibacter sp.]|nr:hypothetical protein [Phnomibacter sp.]
MHKTILRWVLPALLLTCTGLAAQPSEPVQMADTMRSNGKIFVVVAVIVTIFIGLVIYLVRLDRKIAQLEKETDEA